MRTLKCLSAVALLAVFASVLAYGAPPPKKKPAPAAHRPVAAQSAEPSAAAIPFLKQGLAAERADNTAQALQAFRAALGKMGPADPNLALALDHLAGLEYKLQHYPQALVFAQKSHPLLAKKHGANSLEVADNYYFLGNIYNFSKDEAQGESNYRRAIAIYELPANLEKGPELYAATLQNLGVIYSHKGDYESAIAFYKKGVGFLQQHGNKNTGRLLENIGNSYQNLEKLDEAAAYYQQALTAYEQQGADSEDAKRVYFQLANLRPSAVQPASVVASSANRYNPQYYEAGRKAYNKTHNYEEAARQFKSALDEVQKFYPQEKSFIAMLDAYLGQSLYSAGDEDAAEPYLTQALAYQQKNMSPDEPTLVSTHTTLGLIAQQNGEFAVAEKHLQYSIAHVKPDSPDYYSTLTQLAELYCHQGRFEEGRALYQRVMGFYQQTSPGSSEVKNIQHQLALLDKMFQSQSQGLMQYFDYSVQGLRRWEEGQPIQIHISSGRGLNGWNEADSGLVRQAFQTWQTALDNKLQFQFTDNPDKSDVTVSWADKPLAETEMEAQVGVHKLETIRSFFLRSDIVLVLARDGKLRSQEDIYATALHEIGHMLGLSHSGNLSDIMAEIENYSHSQKGLANLSSRDIQAAQILYRQKAAISNPKAITLAEYRKFYDVAQQGQERLKVHDYKQAFQIFTDARALYANDPYINFYLGLCAYRNGDYKEARDVFETMPMPEASSVFSVDSQLGFIYVELGHKYNKWGKKNKEISTEFYDKGVYYLRRALLSPGLLPEQQEGLMEKLREGQRRQRPAPVYEYTINIPMMRF